MRKGFLEESHFSCDLKDELGLDLRVAETEGPHSQSRKTTGLPCRRARGYEWLSLMLEAFQTHKLTLENLIK